MGCMKCGRDLEPGQVFCQDCLADMAKYPVKPGTVVTLPRRQEETVKRAPRKKTLPLDEQVRRLRKRNRNLLLIVVVLALLLGIVSFFFVREILEEDHYRPGQNYSSMDGTEEPDVTKDIQEE